MRTNIFAELTWYPDKDFFNLMDALSNQTKKEATTLWREFGRETFPYFAEIFSDYVKQVESLDKMLTVINRIHCDISKDGLGAPPSFELRKVSGDHFEIRYGSNRNLNDFLLGMLEGAAKYFETSVKIMGRKEKGKLIAKLTIKHPEMTPV